MPTGYTAKIYEDKNVDFKDFVMDCSRAFGAFASLRDEPNAELPEKIQLNVEYYENIIKKSKKEIQRVNSLSDEEISSIIEQNRIEEIGRLKEAIENRKIIEKRYLKVLKEAQDWEPPSEDHYNLKEFMIEQLNTSIQSDCNYSYYEQLLKDLLNNKVESVDEYKNNAISKFEDDITFYTKRIHEDMSKNYDTNVWIKELRDSLKND